MAADAESLVKRIRGVSSLPLAMGFGISTPDQVAQVARWADAAVVGSALVNVIAEHAASADLPARVARYARWLKGVA
jgi:tryptophan synthase alpha chain